MVGISINTNKLYCQMVQENVNLTELAELVGVSRATIHNILSGKRKPQIPTLHKHCNILQIMPSELIIEGGGSNE